MRLIKIAPLLIALGFILIYFSAPAGPDPRPGAALKIPENPVAPVRWQTYGDNAFSASPTEAHLENFAEWGYKVVVRLNGDGVDAGHMSIDEEARKCRELGLRFYYINIDAGYMEKEAKAIARLLDAGRVVVHCKHGMHRAPAVFGYYLKNTGMPTKSIIEILRWDRLAQSPGDYEKYVNLLIP